MMIRLVIALLLLCGPSFAQRLEPCLAQSLRQDQAKASEQPVAEPRVPPNLFRIPRELSPEQGAQLAAIQEEPTAAAIRPVEVNLDALKSPTVKLDLFGRSFTAWRLHTEKFDKSGRSYSWRGALTCAEDFVSFNVEDDRVHGTVRTKGLHLQLEPLGERIHAVIDIKPLWSKEHPPEFPTGAEGELRHFGDRPPLQEPKQLLFDQAAQQRPTPSKLFLFSARDIQSNRLSEAMQARLTAIKARKSTKRVHLFELNSRVLTPDRKALTLNLARDRSFTAHRTEVLGPEQPGGPFTWLGALALEPANMMQLIVNDGMCTATLRYSGELFEIRPLCSGLHALIRIETAKLPGEHPPEFPTGAQDGSPDTDG